MIKQELTTSFYLADLNELNSEEIELIEDAKIALDSAYSPYSGFSVGASVLLNDGKKIRGNNQENVAYPSGLCAERVALFYVGAQFPNHKIKTIAITALSKSFEIEDYISPCGACRQVMAEYEEKQDSKIRILLHSPNNKVLIADSVEDLLPFIFKSPFLKKY
jgi:cytidine deaminase|tara:strand:+ start:2841 stop:3329 length:489 start_codon:yes stop_codon:yes gene_type:complete